MSTDSRRLLLASGLIFCVAQTSLAEVLDPVVITATRQETRVSELIADISVIDRYEIERQAGGGMLDLLSRQAGVQTTQGNRASAGNVYLRGTKGDQTKVLIDGLPLNSVDGNGSPLRLIPLANIERIEILRGPASTLYGADAVGGVIQIITKNASTLGSAVEGYAGVGSYGAHSAAAAFAAGSDRLRLRVDASHDHSRGISDQSPATGSDPDRDGFRQTGVGVALSAKAAAGFDLTAMIRHHEGRAYFDDWLPTVNAYNDFRTRQQQLVVKKRVSDNWLSKWQYGETLDERKTIATFGGGFSSKTRLLSWQNEVVLPIGNVLAGVERQWQLARIEEGFDDKAISNDSLFAAWNGEYGEQRWQLSARRDDNSRFGAKQTFSASYGYRLSPALRAHASIGTSFKAPKLDELFHPAWGGNPDLKPEQGRNRELALTWRDGEQRLSASYYHHVISHLIAWVLTAPNAWGGSNQNIDRASLQGMTVTYEGKMGEIDLHAVYDWLSARDDNRDKLLGRRAKQKANVSLIWPWRDASYGLEWSMSSSRFDTNDETDRLPGYGLVNLSGRWPLGQGVVFEARVNNLFDRSYQLAKGYPSPGLNVFAGLRYTPD